MAKKRKRGASNACSTHSTSQQARRYVEVGSIGKALMVLAEARPEVFGRLASAIPQGGRVEEKGSVIVAGLAGDGLPWSKHMPAHKADPPNTMFRVKVG